MATGPLIYAILLYIKLNYPDLPPTFLFPGYICFFLFGLFFFVMILFFRKFIPKKHGLSGEQRTHRKFFTLNTTSYYSLESKEDKEGTDNALSNKSAESDEADLEHYNK